MLFQTIQIDVKKIVGAPNNQTALYSFSRNQQEPFVSVEVQVLEESEPEIEIFLAVAPKLLGLNILPFDLHSEKAYGNFSRELLKGFLSGHDNKINEFSVYITQAGINFKHSGSESLVERNFCKGDQVIMFGSHEATFPENKAKVWTCLNDSFKDKSGIECVHLDGFSGAYYCKYLALVK